MAYAVTAGGMTAGAGGALAVRRTLDTTGDDDAVQARNLLGAPDSLLGRLTRPSVLYGLGGGGLAAAAIALDRRRRIRLNGTHQDVLTGFALGALPVGLGSFLMPSESPPLDVADALP
jgi:hypothetical protein